jgi:hypothetical protein
MEAAFYAKFDAGYVAFLAENYVDYMTNVMPVPERHHIYLPDRGLMIVCEIEKTQEGESIQLWRLQPINSLPENVSKVNLSKIDADRIIDALGNRVSSGVCSICEQLLKSTIG